MVINRYIMKSIYRKFKTGTLLSLIIILTLSSCLKEDLPEYPLWESKEITNVNVEYRYFGDQEYLGAPLISYKQMDVEADIDENSGVINLNITVPEANGDFSEEEREKVTLGKLWMNVDISTAAKIVPVNGTPSLGDPMDLNNTQFFEVIAADGSKKSWSIKVDEFKK